MNLYQLGTFREMPSFPWHLTGIVPFPAHLGFSTLHDFPAARVSASTKSEERLSRSEVTQRRSFSASCDFGTVERELDDEILLKTNPQFTCRCIGDLDGTDG